MKVIKKIAVFAAVLALSFAIIYFGFHIKNVNVEGTEIYTESEIKASVFTRKFSDNELGFLIYNKIFGINKLPFVEDIDVRYENNNTVTLHVYDKTISGCIRYMGQYVYFDKDGIVLQSLSEHKEGVPIVTGIRFGDFTVGKAFDVEDESLFTAIMNVSQLIAHYNIDVSRINVNNGEITIYSGKVRVLLGKKEMYDDQITALSSVLKTTSEKEMEGVINMVNYKSGDKIILKTFSNGNKDKKKVKNEQ